MEHAKNVARLRAERMYRSTIMYLGVPGIKGLVLECSHAWMTIYVLDSTLRSYIACPRPHYRCMYVEGVKHVISAIETRQCKATTPEDNPKEKAASGGTQTRNILRTVQVSTS